MQSRRIGAVQLDIMRVLWERGSATAREITDALAPSRGLAHSTVQTLLRKLEAKGAVAHDEGARVFVFRAVWPHEEVVTGAAHDLLGRVFGGSMSSLVAHLLKSEDVAPDELRRLRHMIDDAVAKDSEPGGPGK